MRLGAVIVLAFCVLMLTTQHQDVGYAALPKMQVGMQPLITPLEAMVNQAVSAMHGAAPLTGVTSPVSVGDVGNMQIKRAPSISAAQIDAVLTQYNSPAAGSGQQIYDLGGKYGIDPAYALAFFIHESSAGTAGAAVENHNWGNIECAGYPTCTGRWRSYPTWVDGADDWYHLIDTEYVQGRGMTTIDQVVPVYAPSFENDVNGYTNAVSATVAGWREANLPTISHAATTILPVMPVPSAHYNDSNCALWDWYGNGSDCHHYGTDYPAPVGTPVRVPQDCLFINKADTSSYGGGFFQCTLNDGAELYLGHLQNITPHQRGERIPAGTVIGEVYPHPNGSHVHVQLTIKNHLADWETYKGGA